MVRNAHKILVMLSSPIAIKGALCSGPPLQHILVGKLTRRNKQARGQIPSPAPWLLSARQLKKKIKIGTRHSDSAQFYTSRSLQ